MDIENLPENLKAISESIESLITVEIRKKGHHGPGIVKKLWQSVIDKQGEYPTLNATKKLLKVVQKGDIVIIITGLTIENYLPNGENDGPLGAASLAYALCMGIGAIPIILCEKEVVSACKVCLNVIGLRTRPLEKAKHMPWTAVVEAFPSDKREAKSKAKEIIELIHPKAIIAIERISVNEKGVQHTITGNRLNDSQAKLQYLWAKAIDKKILTIGIGDNGNEVGLGVIADEVRLHRKNKARCFCGCNGGIAAAEGADVTVIASVSNWGAYGISACLSLSLNNPNLIHTGEIEERMIEECVKAGTFDGGSALPILSVDGIPAKVHSNIVNIMNNIVHIGLTEYQDRGF